MFPSMRAPVGLNTSAMPYGFRVSGNHLRLCQSSIEVRDEHRREPCRLRSAPNRLPNSTVSISAAWPRSASAWIFIPCRWNSQHPIPFSEDLEHASYDPHAAHRFWRVLMHADRVFQQFSSRFRGQSQPGTLLFGAASIWRSPAFPAGQPRPARVLMPSPAKPIRMK